MSIPDLGTDSAGESRCTVAMGTASLCAAWQFPYECGVMVKHIAGTTPPPGYHLIGVQSRTRSQAGVGSAANQGLESGRGRKRREESSGFGAGLIFLLLTLFQLAQSAIGTEHAARLQRVLAFAPPIPQILSADDQIELLPCLLI